MPTPERRGILSSMRSVGFASMNRNTSKRMEKKEKLEPKGFKVRNSIAPYLNPLALLNEEGRVMDKINTVLKVNMAAMVYDCLFDNNRDDIRVGEGPNETVKRVYGPNISFHARNEECVVTYTDDKRFKGFYKAYMTTAYSTGLLLGDLRSYSQKAIEELNTLISNYIKEAVKTDDFKVEIKVSYIEFDGALETTNMFTQSAKNYLRFCNSGTKGIGMELTFSMSDSCIDKLNKELILSDESQAYISSMLSKHRMSMLKDPKFSEFNNSLNKTISVMNSTIPSIDKNFAVVKHEIGQKSKYQLLDNLIVGAKEITSRELSMFTSLPIIGQRMVEVNSSKIAEQSAKSLIKNSNDIVKFLLGSAFGVPFSQKFMPYNKVENIICELASVKKEDLDTLKGIREADNLMNNIARIKRANFAMVDTVKRMSKYKAKFDEYVNSINNTGTLLISGTTFPKVFNRNEFQNIYQHYTAGDIPYIHSTRDEYTLEWLQKLIGQVNSEESSEQASGVEGGRYTWYMASNPMWDDQPEPSASMEDEEYAVEEIARRVSQTFNTSLGATADSVFDAEIARARAGTLSSSGMRGSTIRAIDPMEVMTSSSLTSSPIE